jgi:hypothetical protein
MDRGAAAAPVATQSAAPPKESDELSGECRSQHDAAYDACDRYQRFSGSVHVSSQSSKPGEAFVHYPHAQRNRQTDQQDGESESERDERRLRECSDALHKGGDSTVSMNSRVVSHAESNRKLRAIVHGPEPA